MMRSKFLNPKNDVAFRKVFGSEKYKQILLVFLNDILGFKGDGQIVDVEFLSPIQKPEIAARKTSIVDVLCKDTLGVQYIIEMQVAPEKGFEKRALYYASKAYMSQLDKGDKKHASLKEVIFIAITDYVVFPKKAHYKSDHIILDKETHEHDMKDIAFTFIELPKYTKGKSEKLTNRIEQWCRYFKYADDTTEEEVEKIVDPAVKNAYEAINQFNWTEEELRAYEARIKQEMDNQAVMEFALEKAEERGMEKGRIEIAKNLLKLGLSTQDIMTATSMTQEQIEALR
jgi:predicted transposase/invertase (TIGR01784 family)